MTFASLLLHGLGWVLPALAMAALMPALGRWVMGPLAWPLRRHMLVHALAGTMVLCMGLVLQGQDGKMATYLALTAVAGTLEWFLHRRG